MNKWLSAIDIRNIKYIDDSGYYDSHGQEFRKLLLYDSKGDVHMIKICLDGKKKRVSNKK